MALAPLLAAAEQPPPLIDLDATIFIQFGIFLVMMAVLYRFVFKPFFEVQDERERRIDGAKRDAEAMQARATAITTDYEARLILAKQRGAQERLKLRGEGQAEERELLAQTRATGQKAMEEAMVSARQQEAQARAALLAESAEIGRQVVGRILGRDPGPERTS